MAMKDDNGNHNNSKENDNRRKRYTQENQKKHDEREKSCSNTEERGQSNLGRRWSGVHGRKNLYTKQQEDKRRNIEGKP